MQNGNWTELFACGQWRGRVPSDHLPTEVADWLAKNGAIPVEDYDLVNPSDDGRSRFFDIRRGAYDAPTVVEDPDNLIALPSGCKYVDRTGAETSPAQLICGIICKDDAGTVRHRFSLSNAQKQGITYRFDDDGTLTLEKDGSQEVFHLQRLVHANKNRILGLIAVCRPNAVEEVQELELEDLV